MASQSDTFSWGNLLNKAVDIGGDMLAANFGAKTSTNPQPTSTNPAKVSAAGGSPMSIAGVSMPPAVLYAGVGLAAVLGIVLVVRLARKK